jgi:acetyl esterase/lipase
MRRTFLVLLSMALLPGCNPGGLGGLSVPDKSVSLTQARRGFTPKLVPRGIAREPAETPPAAIFRTVEYDAPAGKLAAYLSPAPQDGNKHPAIIWITGGDCNSIGDVWSPAPAENDQSARAFREAGILMMYPSLRGGNLNPGVKEGFLGEVDDVQAAADSLAKQDGVDPTRIYLGGHSTGGTLVLLVAETSPRFRAVFAFGPVASVAGYSSEYLPFDRSNRRELELRSPALWLHCIESPVFVLEGTLQSNIADVRTMARLSTNPKIHFHPIPGATHFSTLAPATRLIAGKILRDDGPVSNITFSEAELAQLIGK